VDLDEKIVMQLRHYVQTIASLYNANPFHNFEHANHVVMSVNKLLSRINAPDIDVDADGKMLYDHTYGITSDPLTWFACVFSALIHDVDHSGAPNAQLVKEDSPVARLYSGKSVAEQNSFDIAWDLLLEPGYRDLRRLIYATPGEFKRFRQLVVNSVMATDIVDKDLKKLRNDRWDAVFQEGHDQLETSCEKDLKATIVIEHLIQASDVAHTMQHWHVYRRWNERFFMECYQAYLDGRAEENPANNWYKGELGFFDFYIIPLAKKLKDCGVFGVSSDEYLSYALQNRREWEDRGEEMVKEMINCARRRCEMLKQEMAAANLEP
jgi:3'5'-cyclic nucleotide phosphodiesterase